MAGVDLNTYRFDYDLTFAALLMNASGTIYHTYAGRDWRDPQSHLSVASFASALRKGSKTHAFHARHAKPPKKRKQLTIEELPFMKRRIEQGKAPKCYHCHMVNDARYRDLVARKKWSRADLWTWPDPIQLGLTLEKDDQAVIATVTPYLAAAKAGLLAGDRIVSLGGREIATFGDVQRVLDETPPGKGSLAVTYQRGEYDDAGREATLRLTRSWKQAKPSVFAWRASKWPLSPKPGFGGKKLTPKEMKAAGLPEGRFAFRIGYLVTWGESAATGHNARKAGLRKGDIVVSVNGRDDFESVSHFHAWFRLALKPGTKIPIDRIRNGKRKTIQLPVLK